jgi:glycosyltransferase involved in cell wall biosynthesis
MQAVSVVIPTYNASRHIAGTLASVFAQTRLPVEVVVVDDCSGDDTVAVVEQTGAAAPVPVRIVRRAKNSGGPAAPLNFGIQAARGDQIATLDHDDRMTPNRIADQLRARDACPDVGLILGRVRGQGPPGSRSHVVDKGWEALRSLPGVEVAPGVVRVASRVAYRAVVRHGCYAMTCSAFMFPKAAWARIGGFDERIRTASDLDFLQAVTRARDLAYVTDQVGEWRCSSSSLYSAAGLTQRFEDYWIVLNRYPRGGVSGDLRKEWRRAVREFLFDHAYTFRRASLLRRAAACHMHAALRSGVTLRMAMDLMKIAATGLLAARRKLLP